MLNTYSTTKHYNHHVNDINFGESVFGLSVLIMRFITYILRKGMASSACAQDVYMALLTCNHILLFMFHRCLCDLVQGNL